MRGFLTCVVEDCCGDRTKVSYCPFPMKRRRIIEYLRGVGRGGSFHYLTFDAGEAR